MDAMLMLVLDILVILMLAWAIYYMRIVASSVKTIRQGKTELQQVLKEMTNAIGKAEETIQGMKRLADDKGRLLQKQMDAAETVGDELKFINQAADALAKRLEKNTAGLGQAIAPATPAANKQSAAQGSMSKAERDLAAAMAKRQTEAG